MNFHDNFSIKNRKMDFSFNSAHCASFMKMEAKLKEGGGSAYPYLEQGQITQYIKKFISNIGFLKIYNIYC